jgi:ANTAR domain/GAF domain
VNRETPRPQAPHQPLGDSDDAAVLRTLTQNCSDLMGADATGVMLADADGNLTTAAATGQPAQLTELFDVQTAGGPCPDSYRTHDAVLEADLAAHPDRWPTFTTPARQAGIRAALALPLKRQTDTIGVLGMLTTKPHTFGAREAVLGQSLAVMTSRCLYYQQSAHTAWTLAGQLQTALTSRIVIEQAKGMLAQCVGVHPDQAFDILRSYTRSNRLKLTDVCRQVVNGAIHAPDILDCVPAPLARRTLTTNNRRQSTINKAEDRRQPPTRGEAANGRVPAGRQRHTSKEPATLTPQVGRGRVTGDGGHD